MDKEMFEKGLSIRRQVLGADYVDNALKTADDFNRPLQELVTQYCWGEIWSRPGLDKKTRSLLNLAMISALNRPHEIKVHVKGALTNGVTKEEIREVFLQVAIYCGMPAGVDSFRIAKGLKAKGIVAVDATVSGGLAGAEKGTLAVMVSGPDEVVPRLRPALEVLGKIFVVGREPGQGQTMKLLNNLLSATALAISSEAVVMGVNAGLDPQQILDVINSGTGRNSATADKFPRFVLPRTFNAGFAIGLFNKDIRLCLEEADALGVPMIVGTAVRQLMTIAQAYEGYEADITEIVKPVERWAGVQVEGKKGS